MSDSPPPQPHVAALIANRCRPVHVLKQAAGVETLLAEDRGAGGGLVVIKRARIGSIGSAVAARLQHEAAVLARLGGIARRARVTSGIDDGSIALAQAFLPGETLACRLASGPLTVDHALRVAIDVLAQLSQAHDLGVLHRDVKPASIMLAPGPVATLIDFGLARSVWLDREIRDQAVGTARYVSPEQAGLIDVAVDERSDVYSLGVVLFECLAGRPPFDGADVGSVLRQHLSVTAPDLRALGVRAPRGVGEVIDRMLRKDPSERYQSAAAALAALDAIAAARRTGLARQNEDVQTASEVRLAEAIRLLAEGQPAAAGAVLEQARGEIRGARLRQEYGAAILPWLATALRSQIETLGAGDPARRALVARNRRAARAACRQAGSYCNNLPHALRERSLSAAAAGRSRRARRLIERSIAVAGAPDAAYELGQSQVARGRMGLVLGWPGAAGDLRAGEEALAALGLPGPGTGATDGPADAPIILACADRFAALVNAGRTIAAATSAAAVRRAVADAIPVVLRAERCLVVVVAGDHPAELPDRPAPLDVDVSSSLVRQAVETGQVVTAAPGQAGEVADSLVLSGVRSALCAPISRGGRVVACLYATHRDIGEVFGDEERRLAAFIAAVAGATLEHVEGSEAHFRGLVRNSHDLTVVADPGGRILYVSPSITRVLGYSAKEFAALGPAQVVLEEDRDKVVSACRLAQFSPGSHPTIEVQAQHRDGSGRWLEVTISNLLSDPSIQGLVLNIREITDRKQAELALARATEEFRVSFENAPIGMALTSIDPATAGRWLRVNQSLADMLGYTRAELEGRYFRDFTHPDDLGADEAALGRFARNEVTSFTTVKRYRHVAGRWVWVQLQANMADGARSYVVSQMLDITERRAAEQRLTFLALHDPLTGLANRRLLDDRLSHALARSERSGHQVGVLYIDLDGFKAINDSFGHDRGDQLLLQVADRLQLLVRDSDTLARLGGDEFVLLADELADADQAAAIAGRIEASFARPFDVPGTGEISIGASVGIALAQAGADATTLLRHADIAMYQAKGRGRGAPAQGPR